MLYQRGPIRAALKDIDVTSLKGKRAALVFDIVANEGGGNMAGGRINPGLLFSIGSMMSPVTSTSSAFQIFNLTEDGANYSNTGGVQALTRLQIQSPTVRVQIQGHHLVRIRVRE